MSDEQNFDVLKQSIIQKRPSADQMQSWKNAVRQEMVRKEKSPLRQAVPLLAAMIIGFLLGGVIFSKPSVKQKTTNDDSNATVEYILTKSH